MATELWDAAWRDRWKDEYAEKYLGEKWDGKKQAMVKKELWRLRSGRPVQDIDLMSGAGGVAPAAPKGSTPSATDAHVTSPTATATIPTSPDTGEAAGETQKASIRGHATRLGWKPAFSKMWLKGLFGFSDLDSLTKDQATNATLLAEAFGTPKYKPLLADMRDQGLVRPGEAA
jgi:hypothetical protein